MKKAKNFKLLGTSNKLVELNKIKSKYTVLYFYPKDDTPGCTLETKDFNSFYNKFIKLNCEIYGISKDTIESHLKFKKKYKVKFELLSDENKIAIKEFKKRIEILEIQHGLLDESYLPLKCDISVSYTHLTLPTNLSV